MPSTRNNRWRVLFTVLALLTVIAFAPAQDVLASERAGNSDPTAEQVRFFEAKVRPLLVENCIKCHGPEKQKSSLRLDSRSGAVAGGDQGPAVVPGKPDESLLVTAVRHEDDTLKMPPSKKLPAHQVTDLIRWVQMGAPWPGGETPPPAASKGPQAHSAIRKQGDAVTDQDRAHWAFQPLKRPNVPPQENAPASVRNPIDAFLLAGFAAKGLTPNPPATRTELIRRVSYDLTGLPPTPQDVDAFLNDPAPDAYEALVDRLLDSPHYGEKWGRHWLDLVRFAETNSFERDNPKPGAWRYRDYVIRSLNADKPYDRFVREQLAGDEIAPGDLDALIATGYYRLGIWDDEPADREQAYYDGLDDIVATTGQVFLGLTVDCARCHDHKIDPIPQKDYYRLVSFFRNINHFRNGGPTDEVPLFEDGAAEDAFKGRLRAQDQARAALQGQLRAIEEEFLARYDPGQPDKLRRRDLDDLRYAFYRDTFDRLPDFATLKPEGTGELPSGRFDLAPRSRDDAFGFVFDGTLNVPESGEYAFELDSDDGSRLAVAGQVVVDHDGVHRVGTPRTGSLRLDKGRIPIHLEYFQRTHGLGLSVAWSGPGVGKRSLSTSPSTSERERKPPDIAQLMRGHGKAVLGASRFAEYRTLRERVRTLDQERLAPETALCVTEAGTTPPETRVLLRGNPHALGETVVPAFPTVLTPPRAKDDAASSFAVAIPTPPPGAKSSGRRAVLADWITSPDNPLTARVMANRVWQHHFGRGIVRSPNNFGTQGDKPTQPELLDWLASELVSGGWRLKPLHRQIMTSAAYRRSSRSNPEALAKDPANDAFWRFDMRRLTAEEVRDSVLAISGTLNPKMFGPGIYPTIPAEVLAGQSMPGKGWGRSSPEEAARRSVYIHVKRSLLMPILESFDLAETDRSSPVRFASTQPTQALAMLNGTFLNDQAAVLAARLRREAGDNLGAQVRLALRLVTARTPDDAEVRRGLDLIDALQRDGLDLNDARRAFALLTLNLDEFMFLD